MNERKDMSANSGEAASLARIRTENRRRFMRRLRTWILIAVAVIVALILAIRIFSWPLNKLQSLIDKIPLIPCIVMDSVIMIAAIVTNILIPY